jgi:hypothetical protein
VILSELFLPGVSHQTLTSVSYDNPLSHVYRQRSLCDLSLAVSHDLNELPLKVDFMVFF